MKTYDVEHPWYWITKAKAREIGMDLEGWHCLMPVYCREIPPSPSGAIGSWGEWEGGMDVICKMPFMEWVLDLGGMLVQFVNMFLPMGYEIPFGFYVKPLDPPAGKS